jgi:hypothetical protein
LGMVMFVTGALQQQQQQQQQQYGFATVWCNECTLPVNIRLGTDPVPGEVLVQGGVHSPSYMSPPPGRTCKRL